jgi:hypothetical protein
MICVEPFSVWLSEDWLPNMLDPLEYTILEVTSCTCKSWAVIVPVTVKSPVRVSVVFLRSSDANDYDVAAFKDETAVDTWASVA